MSDTSNIVRGQIVLTGLPDLGCFESFAALIQALPDYLAVEIPNSITNVVVGNTQPTDSQTQTVWFRFSNSGSFLGIYVFSQGAWHPIFPVNSDTPVSTTQIFWLFGDSQNEPAGFTNTNDATILSPAVQAALAAQWVFEAPIYSYYSAIFSGF